MARKLVVQVVGDADSLERTFKKAEGSARRFGRTMERSGKGISSSLNFRGARTQILALGAAFIGSAGLVAGVRNAIQGASDLNEQIGKTEIVFGKSGDAITAWSKTTATAFGISQREALATASSFGALLRPAGFGQREAAQTSRRLTELGSDLAAFYNTDVADALQALQSGVVGQSRPLRRYGVLLSATRVNLVAMAETGKKNATALTDQEKVVARLSIIYKDTALAQGNFALTSGNLAQQQKILHANIQNITDELGQALTPIVLQLVIAMNAWLGNTKNQHRVMKVFAQVLEGVGRVAQAAYGIIRSLIGALGGVGNTLTVLIGAWAGFRAAAVVSATTAMAANLVAAQVVGKAWQASLIATGWGAFAVAAGIAAAYVVTHWDKVRVQLQQIWVEIQIDAYKAARGIAQAFTHLPGFAGGDYFRKRVKSLTDAIRELGYEAGYLRSKAIIDENKRTKEAAKGLKLPPIPPLPPLPKLPKLSAAGLTAKQIRDRRLEALQLAVDQAEVTKTLVDDIKALRALQTYLKQQVALHKKNLDLRRQLLDVNKQLADVLKQQAEARQFRLLGLGPTGEDLVPGVKALQRQLATVRERILGSFLDTRKTRGMLANIRRLLAGGLGALGRDVRQKIAEILANIRQQLKQHQDKIGTGFVHTSAASLLRGLGLSAAQRRALQIRLAGVGPGGAVPAHSGQFTGGGVTVHGDVHVHGVQNPKQLEDQLMKRSKQRAHLRRASR